MRKIRIAAIIFGLLGLLGLLDVFFFTSNQNPYEHYDICFLKEYPGANGRHITYTPVRCSDQNAKLGEPLGADFGHLFFKDLDNDGLAELIVETSYRESGCSLEWYMHSKMVVKVYLTSPPRFEILSHTFEEQK